MRRKKSYIKETEAHSLLNVKNLGHGLSASAGLLTLKQKAVLGGVLAVLILPLAVFGLSHGSHRALPELDDGSVKLAGYSLAATGKTGTITVPKGIVKANPFVPYRNVDGGGLAPSDVPAFELVAPPEAINENSEAARVMDTIVSGILYDKFSPSAILNIEGNDYLVKKGDVVNNYKVVNIMRDSVTVKLGANVYTAGIGEILTEGTLNHNDVSNLKNKFGGGR